MNRKLGFSLIHTIHEFSLNLLSSKSMILAAFPGLWKVKLIKAMETKTKNKKQKKGKC